MFSFIVIGRNEGSNLGNCFNSIYSAISFNSIKKYEIIYVDSKSVDESILVAKKFKEVKIYSITGDCSSAIARNIGATEANGDILFFIDGDMKINRYYLSSVVTQDKKIKYNLLTGSILNIYKEQENTSTLYNPNFKFLSCGIFLIKKEIWDSANGMRTKYLKGEDPDLGLRLIKKGHPIVVKTEIVTKHFTVQYFDKARIWKMLWNKDFFYTRCVLYRDHVLNRHMYKYLFYNDKTFILLISLAICSLLSSVYIMPFIIVYLIAISLRSFKQSKQIINITLLEFMLFFIVLDLLNLIFLFTFFPKAKETEYIKVD